jgi:hypothetical protein
VRGEAMGWQGGLVWAARFNVVAGAQVGNRGGVGGAVRGGRWSPGWQVRPVGLRVSRQSMAVPVAGEAGWSRASRRLMAVPVASKPVGLRA